MKLFRLFCISTFVLLACLQPLQNAQAQSLAGSNLSTINVDDLSDAQILNYIKQAESSGYSEVQLEAFARQRGMPASEIAKLRRRVESLRSGGTNPNQASSDQSTVGGRQKLVMSEADVFGKLANSENSNQLTETQRKIYGYDLFQSDKLTGYSDIS